ncbi:MAG: hypothetical protein ACLPV8_29110 [Steroidobacteraceae bacterium]
MAKRKPNATARGHTAFFDYWDQTTKVPTRGSFAETDVAYVEKLATVVLADGRVADAQPIASRCLKLIAQLRACTDTQHVLKIAFRLGAQAQRLDACISEEGEVIRAYRRSKGGASNEMKDRHELQKEDLDSRNAAIDAYIERRIADGDHEFEIISAAAQSWHLSESTLKKRYYARAKKKVRAKKPAG